FFQAEDGIRDSSVTGVQTCALPICVDVLLSGTINNLAKNPALLTAGNPALIDELKQRVAPYPIANAIVVLDADGKLLGDSLGNRSEERRVGKECRCGSAREELSVKE